MQPPAAAHDDVVQAACTALERMRSRKLRVHCITNAVAQNFTANMLLAVGCVPSMTLSPEEVAAFVADSQALMINLGTFDAERRQATDIAVRAASENGVPWVLDPVFVDRSARRAHFARALVGRGPKAARLNGAEFSTLAGGASSPEKLADFARRNRLVVALSGETDTIADGERLVHVANGHPFMSKVTAMGCAASALVAACLAVEDDVLRAAAAALVILGVAGELAAAKAEGPGTFAVAIIDALYHLDAATLRAHARVTR